MELNAGGLSSLVVGRENEIQTLKTYIGFGQHTVISAPRRYGKTTLANRVLDELKNDYLIVKLDIFEATSIDEICDLYLNAIYGSIGITNFLYKAKESIFNLLDRFNLSYEIEGIKLGYEISKEQDINKKIEKTFNFANKFAELFDKKMIVFIDEFGDTEKFGQDFIKKRTEPEVREIVYKAVRNYLTNSVTKGCVFFDKKTCRCAAHSKRPLICRLYAVIHPTNWKRRIKSVKNLYRDYPQKDKNQN